MSVKRYVLFCKRKNAYIASSTKGELTSNRDDAAQFMTEETVKKALEKMARDGIYRTTNPAEFLTDLECIEMQLMPSGKITNVSLTEDQVTNFAKLEFKNRKKTHFPEMKWPKWLKLAIEKQLFNEASQELKDGYIRKRFK